MKVISVNIGNPCLVEWRGQQISTGIYKYPVNVPVFLGETDVESDHVIDRRYHGGIDKACYLYSADNYSFWKVKYPNLTWQWGMFGENLTVEGLDESFVRIGDQFCVGKAVVQVSQPRQPCFKLGIRLGNQASVDDFWNLPYPGVYLRILSPGFVQEGDHFELIKSNPDSLSVAEVFSLFRKNRFNTELIQKAVNDPFLAASCRKDLQKL